MTDQDQPQGPDQGQPELGNIANSILMAFNLGVTFNQQTGGTKSLPEVVGELGNTIYTNLTQAYGTEFQEEFLQANTEYFLQIAMLGYIVPGVCAYEEEFKDKLLSLIEVRASKQAEQMNQQGGPGGSSIITP
jgi:hypothetical protein